MADDEKKVQTTRASVKRPSPRELEVLKLIVCGKRNHDIAAAFGISEKTVEAHRANLCRKFGVRGLVGLMVAAVVRGFVTMPTITDEGEIQHGGGNGPREAALLEAARAVCVPCRSGRPKQAGGSGSALFLHDGGFSCDASRIYALMPVAQPKKKARVAR